MWEIVGHKWAVELLARGIQLDKLSHAYLLIGPPQVGRATPWRIEFDLPEVPVAERAILRLAISGTGARLIKFIR